METNAVFSARPVTNLAYQTGKVLGIVEVCLVLNLITMGLGMIFHILFGEPETFQLKIYFVYLFVMTLPTLSELSLYWTLTSKPAFLRVVVALSSESPTTLGMTTSLVPLETW